MPPPLLLMSMSLFELREGLSSKDDGFLGSVAEVEDWAEVEEVEDWTETEDWTIQKIQFRNM